MEVNLKKLKTVTVVSMLYDMGYVVDDVLRASPDCSVQFKIIRQHLLDCIGESSYRVVVQPKMFKLLREGKLTFPLSH